MKVQRAEHYTARMLSDGKILWVFPLTFGRARLSIGGWLCFDNEW